MEQGCRAWLEPRYWGTHDLMVRLLGRCTCEAGEARVVELFEVEDARDPVRVSA